MSSLARVLVALALKIESWATYQKIKKRTWHLLSDPRSRARGYFDFFMMTLVIVTVAILIYDLRGEATPLMLWIDRVAVVIFILEYLARFWVASDCHKIILNEYHHALNEFEPFSAKSVIIKILRAKWAYVSSFYAVVDLLSIIPSYRPLRFLRIFLLFRLLKIFRYTTGLQEFFRVIVERRHEFTELAFLVAMVVLVSALALFIFEGHGQNDRIASIFDTIYWAVVTVATVGYGDIAPVTTEGRIVSIFLIIAGVAFLAFTISIVTTSFTEKLGIVIQEREKTRIKKMRDFVILCGYGKLGQETAMRLLKDGITCVVIDQDEKMVRLARERGMTAIQADATHTEILRDAGVTGGATHLYAMANSDYTNLLIVLTARSLSRSLIIVSKVNDPEMTDKFYHAGCNHIVNANTATALMGVEYTYRAVAYEVLEAIVLGEKSMVVEELLIPEGSRYEGATLEEIEHILRGVTLFGVIGRDRSFIFNPDRSTFRLEGGMLLVVLGKQRVIAKLEQTLIGEKR
ncbi:MAG: NAD-binding protein [Campylobacterales bacterium]